MLAGGKQRDYQGTTFRKPFFFLLVDSVLGSLLGAAGSVEGEGDGAFGAVLGVELPAGSIV